MAHVKSGGSTRLGRDSVGKRLGVKLFGSEKVSKGQIIVRQRGSKWKAGKNTKKGSDDTIYSLVDGVVVFSKKTIGNFYGKKRLCTVVSVIESENKS